MPITTDEMTPELEHAIRRLVEGFDNIPQSWAALVAEHLDKDEFVPMPIWGTLFKVSNMDQGNIEKLIAEHDVPTGAVELIEWAEERGIEIEESEMKLLALAAANDDEDRELEMIRDGIIDSWYDSGEEDAQLSMGGWRSVGSTGLLAREFDGMLLLGINGAGYDFYDSHWRRLYEELGYSWHGAE